MLMKRIKPRKFDYTPRYFKEEKDENDDGRRIRFGRMGGERKKKPSMLKLVLIVIVVLVLIYYLNDIAYFTAGQ